MGWEPVGCHTLNWLLPPLLLLQFWVDHTLLEPGNCLIELVVKLESQTRNNSWVLESLALLVVVVCLVVRKELGCRMLKGVVGSWAVMVDLLAYMIGILGVMMRGS